VQTDIGFSRNLGDPVVSSANSRLEPPGPVGVSVAQRVFPATELGFDQMEIEF
jgi:hypothetical protein